MTKHEIEFDAFAKTKHGAMHDAIMHLIHAMSTSTTPEYVFDEEKRDTIIGLVGKYMTDEIGVKTCVPYRDEHDTPCYKLNTCPYEYCMFKTSTAVDCCARI